MGYGATAHNRIVCAAGAVAPLAYEKPQSGLRPIERFFSGTFCPPRKPLRGFFIAAVKTSHTTGTLCAIVPKIYVKIIKNDLTKTFEGNILKK
jgi:hypothetical protein